MGCLTNCVNSRACLRIRRNETIQRTTRRMDKAPNGIWSSFPAIWACVAWVLSITSSCLCGFISRTVNFIGENQDRFEGPAALLLRNQGIGFWGWEGEGTCYSYTIMDKSPSFDGAFLAASAFSTVTDALGGILTVCLLLGTVFPIRPSSYELIGYFSLLMALLDGCTLAILGSNVCSAGFFDYTLERPRRPLLDISTASCGMGIGSSLAIVASVFWFVTAIGCLRTPLASRGREPGPYRGNHKDAGEADAPEDPDDSAHELYRQRQAENDKRYRELMGENVDDESVDEEGQPGFESLRKPQLSLVREEPEIESETRSRRQSDSMDQYEGEYQGSGKRENPEERSQYSDGMIDDDDDDDPDSPSAALLQGQQGGPGGIVRRSSSRLSGSRRGSIEDIAESDSDDHDFHSVSDTSEVV